MSNVGGTRPRVLRRLIRGGTGRPGGLPRTKTGRQGGLPPTKIITIQSLRVSRAMVFTSMFHAGQGQNRRPIFA